MRPVAGNFPASVWKTHFNARMVPTIVAFAAFGQKKSVY